MYVSHHTAWMATQQVSYSQVNYTTAQPTPGYLVPVATFAPVVPVVHHYHAGGSPGDALYADGLQEVNSYTDQMLDDKQQKLGDYMNSMVAYNNDFPDVEGVDFDLDQLLDNIAEGKPVAQLANGEEHPQADMIEQYYGENSHILNPMATSRAAVENFPESLPEWMNMKGLEMSSLGKLTYASEMWNAAEEGQDAIVADSSEEVQTPADDSMQQLASQILDSYQRRMQAELSDRWGQYTDSRDDLNDKFSEAFEFSEDSPEISLQDMVQNYLNGDPLTMMADGSEHPDTEALQQFWAENKPQIEQMMASEEAYQDQPSVIQDWLAQNDIELDDWIMDQLDLPAVA